VGCYLKDTKKRLAFDPNSVKCPLEGLKYRITVQPKGSTPKRPVLFDRLIYGLENIISFFEDI